MQNCVNDFSPIILAIATLLTVQVPIVIGLFINQWKIKHDVAVSKSLNYSIDRKTDVQTVILRNGYHGEKGEKGEKGEPGPRGISTVSEINPPIE